MSASDDTGKAKPAPLPAWFTTMRRLVDAVTGALNVIGTLLIVAIMVLVNTDVIGRSVFNSPVSGVPEIVSMSIVAIVFLQIAQTFRWNRLTRSEAVLNFIKARSQRVHALVELFFSLASIILIWQLLSASWPLFLRSWQRHTYEGTIGNFTAPVWPVKLIILIGSAALVIQLVLFAASAAFRLFQRPPKGEK